MEILTIYRRVPVCVNWRVTEEGGDRKRGIGGEKGKERDGKERRGREGADRYLPSVILLRNFSLYWFDHQRPIICFNIEIGSNKM